MWVKLRVFGPLDLMPMDVAFYNTAICQGEVLGVCQGQALIVWKCLLHLSPGA